MKKLLLTEVSQNKKYSPPVYADELTDTDIDSAIELLQLMKKKGYTRVVSQEGNLIYFAKI